MKRNDIHLPKYLKIMKNAGSSLWLFLFISLSLCSHAKAQTTWSTNATDGQMTNGSNWTGGIAPSDNSGWAFTNSSKYALTNGFSGYTVTGITFANYTGSGYGISGNAFTLTDGITNNSIVSQAITNNLTINSTVVFTNTANNANAYIQLRGALSGNGQITFGAANASSRLELYGANSNFTGSLIVNSGRLNFGIAAAGSSNADYTFNMGPTTTLGDVRVTAAANATNIVNMGSLSGSALIQANGSTSNSASILAVGHKGTSTTFSGNISSNSVAVISNQSFSFVKMGSGTLTLNGTNTYNGTTTISNGILQIGAGGAAGSISNSTNITLAGGTLAFNRSDTVTQGTSYLTNGGVITGNGGFFQMGGGINILNKANTFSGTTKVSSGTLVLSNNQAIQSSAFDTTGFGTLSLGSGVTTPTLGGLSGNGNFNPTGYNSVTSLTLNVANGASYTYSGNLNNGTTGMTLIKGGAGTQILSGSNTYTGPISVLAGKLQFAKKSALYGGNTGSWDQLVVSSGATLGLSLNTLDGFSTADINSLLSNPAIMTAGAQLDLADVTGSYGPITMTNSANPNGVALAGLSGSGGITLTGYSTYTNPVTLNGTTLRFTNLPSFSGPISLSGNATLDLGGASYAIPNSTNFSSGQVINAVANADPFAPTGTSSYTGFSFIVTNLNNGSNGTPTFNLTNSVITVAGSLNTNGFNISGGSGVMRFTGATTNPIALSSSNTPVTSGIIQVQNGATLEFSSNSSFNSYRAITASSSNNPTILISGGTLTGVDYFGVGGGTNNTGTLRIKSGSVTLATNSANGIFMGQSTGTGSFIMEGGNFTGNNTYGVFKIANGTANVTISSGTVSNPSPTVWGLSGSGGGVVNFTMTGGQFAGTNAKFNFGQYTANASFTQTGGLMDLKSSEAWLGTYSLSGGTNRANFMTIGMSGNTATYTVSSTGVLAMVDPSVTGLLRLGDAGSTGNLIQNGGSVLVGTGNTKKDIYVGYGSNGIGRYELRGGVLDLNGEILVSSNASGSLVLDGGTLRSSAGVGRTSFIASNVVTQVGANGAVIEVANAGVTNTIQAVLSNMGGQVGNLVKLGAGTLSISRTNLSYTGSTRLEEGSLLVVGGTSVGGVGYNADVRKPSIVVQFASVPAAGDQAKILPGSYVGLATSAEGIGPNSVPIPLSFDANSATVTVQAAQQNDPFQAWAGSGATLTSDLLLKYSIGGASSPTATDGQSPHVTLSGNAMILSILVRANDSALKYQPQISDDLSTDSWIDTNANYNTSTSGVPANFERREYSVPATNPRLFLRIQVTK
jgi:autotransporter-associated beta strand protein